LYECTASASLNTLANTLDPANDVYAFAFFCTDISLFVTGTSNFASTATQCLNIRTACLAQSGISISDISLDMCPLPFIDLIPPASSNALCNRPSQSPTVQYLHGQYYTREFNCYRLSTSLTGVSAGNVGKLYRCVPRPTETEFFLECDLTITTPSAYVSNSRALADRV